MNCIQCHQDKPPSDFETGRSKCKRCRLDEKKQRYDPARQKLINDRASWKTRARRYGMPEHELRAMWDAQGHRCAICDRSDIKAPHVDHCHATGRVRGFLCASCNRVLGFVQDKPERLERAAAYLRR